MPRIVLASINVRIPDRRTPLKTGKFVRNSALQSALREVTDQYRSPPSLAVLGATSVVLGISGPFGTLDSLDLGWRLAYWSLVVPLTYAAGSFGSAIGRRALAGAPLWKQLLLIGFLSAFLVWTVLLVTHSVLGFSFARIAGFHADFPVLVLICLVIEGAREVFTRSRTDADGAPVLPPTEPPPRLLERLPEDLRGDLVSISVNDHYVAVTTTLGCHDVLLRLSDAMAEAEPVQGLQVHRSHWVALAQVQGWQRTADKVVLSVTGGAQIPVSRGKLKSVEAAGLLDNPPGRTPPMGAEAEAHGTAAPAIPDTPRVKDGSGDESGGSLERAVS